jgi:porphobilinogen deaminase
VGAYATVGTARAGRDRVATIHLAAVLASGDGRVLLRMSADGDHPAELGRNLAREMLERAGGARILEDAAPPVAPAPT